MMNQSTLEKHHIQNLSHGSDQNLRLSQQDRYLIESFGKADRFIVMAICDGHGSTSCAEFIKDHFIPYLEEFLRKEDQPSNENEEMIKKASNKILEELDIQQPNTLSGSTLNGILLDANSPGVIWTFNLGDSKTVIYNEKFEILHETVDHNMFENRRNQILAKDPSANISFGRLQGPIIGLNLSGAYGNTGDHVVSKGLLRDIEVSRITRTKIKSQKKNSNHTNFHVIIGSDGIFNEISPMGIADLIEEKEITFDAKVLLKDIQNNAMKGDNATVIMFQIVL